MCCNIISCVSCAGVFEGVVGIVAQGAVMTVLWYGGKLVYENHEDSSRGITPGILTGT